VATSRCGDEGPEQSTTDDGQRPVARGDHGGGHGAAATDGAAEGEI
jgi:hypothetical protein